VELTPAVVGHDHAADPEPGGLLRVLSAEHALEHDRTLPLLLQPADLAPSQAGFELAVDDRREARLTGFGTARAGAPRAFGQKPRPTHEVDRPTRPREPLGQRACADPRWQRKAVAPVALAGTRPLHVDGDHQRQVA